MDNASTLYLGDIPPSLDEKYLAALVHSVTGVAPSAVRLMRDSGAFGFCDFRSQQEATAALSVLHPYGGLYCQHTQRMMRVNWAQRSARALGHEYSLFVGDIGADVTSEALEATFRARFPSVTTVHLPTDRVTGNRKSFGFVRFGSEVELETALQCMGGTIVGSRAIRVGRATQNVSMSQSTHGSTAHAGIMPATVTMAYSVPPHQQQPSAAHDPSQQHNRTVFVGNLPPAATGDELQAYFDAHLGAGRVQNVNIPTSLNACGFVDFLSHEDAAHALTTLTGRSSLRGFPLRLGWGQRRASRTSMAQTPATPWFTQVPAAATVPVAVSQGVAHANSALTVDTMSQMNTSERSTNAACTGESLDAHSVEPEARNLRYVIQHMCTVDPSHGNGCILLGCGRPQFTRYMK